MAKGQLLWVLNRLRGLHGPAEVASSDGELLGRFADFQDEAAFTALVQRHAGLVRGVCRRQLADSHAVEDACQATFLVLLRKASVLDLNGRMAVITGASRSIGMGIAKMLAVERAKAP